MILENLEKVKQYINEKKISEAIDILNSILSSSNREFHRDAFFELGKIYYCEKKYELSINNLYSALQLKNNDKNTLLLLAKALKDNNKGWSSLKVLLKLRSMENDAEFIREIDCEVNSILLSVDKYILAIKYMDKYCVKNIDLKNKIYEYLLHKITKYNNNNDFNSSIKLSSEALKKLNIEDIKIKNAILNEYEVSKGVTHLKSFPRVLTIGLTEKCNLKCRMCSQNKDFTGQELSTQQVNNIIKIFPFVEKVLWVGGEVFLYKGFGTLMDIANKYNIKQNITSNGLLITDDYAKKIVNYEVELNLSIDSVDRKTYEYIRVGSNYDVLINNIKRIKYHRQHKEKNANLVLNAVLSKWNYNIDNNFYDIIVFAKEYGFDGVNIYQDAFELDNDIRRKTINKFNADLNRILDLSKKLNIKLTNFVYDNYKHFEVQNINNDTKSTNNKNCINIDNTIIERKTEDFIVNDNVKIEDYACYENKSMDLHEQKCLLLWKKLYISQCGDVFIECHCPKMVQLRRDGINYSKISNSYNDIIEVWNCDMLVKYRKLSIENKLSCLQNCYLTEEFRKPIAFR